GQRGDQLRRPDIDAVTTALAVHQHVQRHDGDVVPLGETLGKVSRGVGDDGNGHGVQSSQPAPLTSDRGTGDLSHPDGSSGDSVAAMASPTKRWPSQPQCMPSGLPRPLNTCSPTMAGRSTSGTFTCFAQRAMASAAGSRTVCTYPYDSARWIDGRIPTIGSSGRSVRSAPTAVSR